MYEKHDITPSEELNFWNSYDREDFDIDNEEGEEE